ncbi:MAG: tetratricopeptide repeat protein, partial [Thermoanaerobaculia bacterium]
MVEPGRGAASRQTEAQVSSTRSELFSVADLEQAAANHQSAIKTYRRILDGEITVAEKARALMGIGTCLERLGRWKETLNILVDASVAAREAGNDLVLARVLVMLGDIRLGLGETEAALDCARESLERVEALEDVDPKEKALVHGLALSFLGKTLNFRGDLEESATYIARALGAFKVAGDIRRLGYAYNNLGLIHKQRCDWSRALEYLQVASSLQAIEGEYPERRAGMHNLGLVHYHMGNWARARECFDGALSISRDVSDPLGIIRGLLATAGVDLVQRRWDAALESLEQSLELCSEELYPQEIALTYRSLGQLHQAREEFPRARRCFEVAWRKAVEVSEEGDLARELLRLRAELALEEGQLADAANLAERAVDLSTRTEDRREMALAHLSLARVQFAQGDERAFESVLEAEDMLRRLESPLPLVQALVEEARMRLESKRDLDRAEAAYQAALELLGDLSLPEMFVETLIGLTRVATARGELNRAGDYLEEARRQASGLEDPGTASLLAEAQKDFEERLVQTSVNNLGAFRTAGRIEEIVESRRPYAAKLSDVLEILAQGVEADGAALIFAREDHPSATFRIGTASTQKLARALRKAHPEQPQIVLDTSTAVSEPWAEVVGSRKASSLLLIPIYGNGSAAYLYLDRLEEGRGSAFGPSHLNLCLALAPQLESLIDRVSLETLSQTDEDSLKRRTFLADVVTQNPEMIEIL